VEILKFFCFFYLLQLREWDVWQTSHSHVDVYFPRRVIAETELGHLPFHLPPGTSHRIDGWNHDASSYTHAHAPSPPATAPTATDKAGEIRIHWDVVSPSNATFHGQYHPLEEMESFVRDLAAAYPRQLSVVRLGHSGEGREMFALEISSDTLGAGGDHVSHDSNSSQVVLGKKKGKGRPIGAHPRCGFLITGAQHAREVSIFIFFAFMPSLSKTLGFLFLVGCLCFRVVYRACFVGRPFRGVFSRASSKATCKRVDFLAASTVNVDQGHRTFTLSPSLTQMDTCIPGSMTDFGASIAPSVFFFPHNEMAGTRIACNMVLTPVASVLT
jgi:hypothetical protein